MGNLQLQCVWRRRYTVLLLRMHQLSSSTVRLLSSSQVITAVISVVKELVENALDAFATNIEVKLENFGFDKIEVRDNGIGIKAADTPFMGIKHYTSKISGHEDLETLQTYGFRGEALSSICSIAEVHIITKTATEPISTQYFLDNNGHVVTQKPSHLGQGTMVTVMKLFKNMPVRKQYYATEKKCKEELKKVQDLLISYGLIKPEVRITLAHNKMILWQKNKVSDQKMALVSVLGTTVMNAMAHIQHQCENPEIVINGYFPSPDADSALTSVHGPDKSFIYVNHRPVYYKDILKMVRMHYNRNKDSSCSYPIFFISILVPPSSVDVNLMPDKTQVLLHDKEFIYEAVEKVLKSLYPKPVTMSICKLNAQSKDNITNCIEPPSTVQHKMNTENKNGEEQNLSLSPKNDNGKNKMKPHLYMKDQSSIDDHSLKLDMEQVAGKVYSATPTISSSDQVNQKGSEVNTGAKIQEVKAWKNTTTSNKDDLITDDTWSRGNAFRNNTLDNIQPVTIMCPSAVSCDEKSNEITLNTSHHENTDQKTTNIITEKSGFITPYDLLNNQVIRRPLSAKDVFTQEQRVLLLNDRPDVPFDDISSVILELWEKLSEEGKLRYEEEAATDLQRYKMQTTKATGEVMNKTKETGKKLKLMLAKSPAQKVRLKTALSNHQILDQLFQSQIEKKSVVPAIKTMKIGFSLYNLKQKLYKLGRKEMLDFEEINLISKLNVPGAWIVASKKEISLLNPYRVEEALLYKRLVENYKIPVEKLESPVILNERLIGGPQYFTTLLSMQKDSPRPNGHVYFSDARLTYNGFIVKMIPGSPNIVDHVEIEGITGSLPFYGISDLKEVLSSVMNGNANLCECRPLKVLNYLEGEAVRLARQLPLNLSTIDVQDTIHRMKKQLNSNQKRCIHGRPFFHHLLNTPESDG